jgi:hypothetical protein
VKRGLRNRTVRSGRALLGLADGPQPELRRTFVEAHDRPLGIGRLGMEIKHVLHAGDAFAIDLQNAPHVFAPGLEAILAGPPNRLVGSCVR